jgi:hypothetical protein
MLTTPRLVAIAALRGTQFRDRQHRLSVKLPIFLDSIGTILCALLIFPDRLAAIACAFIAGFIAAILTGLVLNPFLPWFSLTVLAIQASACFALASRRAIRNALAWSANIVLPLVLFMMIVWVGIVGCGPHEIAANLEGSRSAAAIHVAIICLRLFVTALTVQIAFLHFAGWTPLRFIGRWRSRASQRSCWCSC